MRRVGPRNMGAIYVWIVLIVVFSIASPSIFFTAGTAKEVLNQYSITGLVGLALVLPLAAGLYDLSVGATAGLTGIVTAWMLANVSTSVPLAVIVGLAAAVAMGLINSFVVLGMGVDSFIGTLATSSIYTAIAVAVSGQQPISQNVNGAFSNDIALKNIGGVTIPVLYMIVVLLILAYVLEKSIFGRHAYAIGFDREVARLGGVRVRATQAITLVACSVVAGVAGISEAAVLGAGSPESGPNYLLPGFAAAFLGATQFRHGRFNPWGVVVAVLLLGTGDVGLLTLGAPSWSPDVFEGVMLIAAVGLTSARGFGPLPRLRRRGGGGGETVTAPLPPSSLAGSGEERPSAIEPDRTGAGAS
ncbi:MAG: ABC transporter permease [Solirubrobacteraceae bacterium]